METHVPSKDSARLHQYQLTSMAVNSCTDDWDCNLIGVEFKTYEDEGKTKGRIDATLEYVLIADPSVKERFVYGFFCSNIPTKEDLKAVEGKTVVNAWVFCGKNPETGEWGQKPKVASLILEDGTEVAFQGEKDVISQERLALWRERMGEVDA